MTRDEKVGEILEEFAINCCGTKVNCDEVISQLNALYKVRIDERKLFKIIDRFEWNGMTYKDLAHAIAQKAEEIIRRDN